MPEDLGETELTNPREPSSLLETNKPSIIAAIEEMYILVKTRVFDECKNRALRPFDDDARSKYNSHNSS
jgi:hypothetical protein